MRITIPHHKIRIVLFPTEACRIVSLCTLSLEFSVKKFLLCAKIPIVTPTASPNATASTRLGAGGDIQLFRVGTFEGSRRTAMIVKGLRNFSRLDTEDMKLVNINEGIESTMPLIQNQLSEKNIEVITSLGDIPEIEGYPGQLNQVFMNLLTNAIDAINTNGKIFIRTWKDKNFVGISIRDTGKGMNEEVKQKIFDPFFTTKEIGRGTGLGLSISYGIIEKHKGKIEVKTESGSGTEFIILLPS